MEIVICLLTLNWSVFVKAQFDQTSVLAQKMDCRGSSQYLNQWQSRLLTHICVSRLRWENIWSSVAVACTHHLTKRMCYGICLRSNCQIQREVCGVPFPFSRAIHCAFSHGSANNCRIEGLSYYQWIAGMPLLGTIRLFSIHIKPAFMYIDIVVEKRIIYE